MRTFIKVHWNNVANGAAQQHKYEVYREQRILEEGAEVAAMRIPNLTQLRDSHGYEPFLC